MLERKNISPKMFHLSSNSLLIHIMICVFTQNNDCILFIEMNMFYTICKYKVFNENRCVLLNKLSLPHFFSNKLTSAV